jgi:hypothetical protein
VKEVKEEWIPAFAGMMGTASGDGHDGDDEEKARQ